MGNGEDKTNVWKFRLTDKIANISQVSIEEKTEFWLESMKLWFYGYKTSKDYKVTIWGRKVDFSFSIAPVGMPTDYPPVIAAPQKKKRTTSLPPEQRAYVNSLKVKIKELKEHLPELPDEAMEKRYWDYLDRQSFIDNLQCAAVAWDNKEADMIVKCREASEYLARMLPALQAMHLPDELMRDDTKFSLVLARVLQFARIVEENAEKNRIDLPVQLHELIVFIDDFTDRMIEGGNKLFGIERRMTLDEHNASLELDGEALYGDKPIEERLVMLQTLWENRLLSPVDRIEYLEQAIELVKKQNRKRQEIVPCPHEELIKKHLSAIHTYVKELEDEGETVWRRRMAEGMAESLVSWREATGEPPLSVEDFASRIDLQSLHIKTEEQEDGRILYELELYFQDRDDSFAGHIMYALVKNHVVKEITLMG